VYHWISLQNDYEHSVKIFDEEIKQIWWCMQIEEKKVIYSILFFSKEFEQSMIWCNYRHNTWWKTLIKFLLMRTAFQSTSHKTMIAWSKIKYSIVSQFSRILQLTDLSLKYDKWCIQCQWSFFFNTSFSNENIKRWKIWRISVSRSQRNCCIKSTWRVSETSFVERRLLGTRAMFERM